MKQTSFFRAAPRAAACAVLLASMGASFAQAQNPPAPPAPAPAPAPALPEAPAFSDSQLESFIAVQPGLQEVRMEYSARLEQTNDTAEAAELQQLATQDMIEVIEEEGMEVNVYNQIAVALEQDQDLRSRMETMLD